VSSAAEFVASLPVSALADVAGPGAVLSSEIRQQTPGVRCGGLAYPVEVQAGDNLAIHQALAEAPAGSVIVAAIDGPPQCGMWGEMASATARTRGVRGFVTDGHVRDLEALPGYGVGVFARGPDPRKPGKAAHARVGDVDIGGVDVTMGDVVVADADGVVVVPADEVVAVAARAAELLEREGGLLDEISAGRTTLEVLGLPARQ
jgi:4-hydroxy-4-methyl-2-oxoglutarate aldolase